ncbi:MAG TPA: arylesterase [Rhodothermales bacterium]|nr:arylesterase [Rhodothermales bacterium]
MRSLPLYPALLLCVLLFAACEQDTSSSSGDERAATHPAAETSAAPPRPDSASVRARAPVVVAMGNSITAGYGLDPEEAYPALLQQKIDSLGWDFKVVNAGVSGETSAGGLSRIGWLLQQPVDVLIIELGANDMLRGIPPATTKKNLQGIIDSTRARYPDARIILAGMRALPNYGADYVRRFEAIYPDLARENDIPLIPFLLENVAGIPRLNQSDGIHPTAEGDRIVARNVWKVLRPVLEGLRQEPS